MATMYFMDQCWQTLTTQIYGSLPQLVGIGSRNGLRQMATMYFMNQCWHTPTTQICGFLPEWFNLISQHWFKKWLGAKWQQCISRTSADILRRHKYTALCLNDLIWLVSIGSRNGSAPNGNKVFHEPMLTYTDDANMRLFASIISQHWFKKWLGATGMH